MDNTVWGREHTELMAWGILGLVIFGLMLVCWWSGQL